MTDPLPLSVPSSTQPPSRAGPPIRPAASVHENAPLWQAAREIETSFLNEMLKSAGLGETPEVFGGGAGEDQFASFLREEQARAMVEAGGIGLADTLYRSLQKEMRR